MSEAPERPPRLRPLDREEVGSEIRELFDYYMKERGNIPNMFRTVARRPEHLRTMLDHFRTVMRAGTVRPLLKEFVSVRVSAINGCRY